MLRFVAFLLVGLTIAAVSGGSAHACSCVSPGPPATFVQRADAIFEGVAVKLELIGADDAADSVFAGSSILLTTLKVQKVFKGRLPTWISVESRLTAPECGWQSYPIGQPLIVVVNRRGESYYTSSCAMGPLFSPAVNNPYIDFIQGMIPRDPE